VGETGLEPEGVDVEAKRDETEALEALYGKEDTEDTIDCASVDIRAFGLLSDIGLVTDSGGLKGVALLEGVIKSEDCAAGEYVACL
jgi:hypothetical protein